MTNNNNNGNYISKRNEAGGPSSSGDGKLTGGDDHVLDAALGFENYTDGPERLGWLMNMNSSQRLDKETGKVISCVSCYFMCQDGSMFKSQIDFFPYFYVIVKEGMEAEVDALLRRRLEGRLKDSEIVEREDLDLKNHLSGLKRRLLKLTFSNMDDLVGAKREIAPIASRNRARGEQAATYAMLHGNQQGDNSRSKGIKDRFQDALEGIHELREHDVPYHVRFAIDTDVRCAHWFIVAARGGHISMERRPDLLQRAEPRICAFDIETTKLPLQFPNAEYDQVFMISYMIDKQGYLIINKEVVGADIEDFEYSPKPEFEGPFKVFNAPNEAALLRRWFDHMREVKPAIYVTYNGDWFDFPFIETRAGKYGMDMDQEIGFSKDDRSAAILSRSAVHMDCLHWVNRDSYLPQGSRGLKAVTKAKLGYDPVEVDPEDMVRLAAETPQDMASYSVSDAVCTYYLYMTYIHPFIFSLANIIPMPPDEVLRKGSGTLCEMLLMVQAYQANIVAPNKHTSANEKMYNGHLLESETYIGGKVEALESGVFRADLPCKFRCRPEAYQMLIDKIDADLEYALREDGKMEVADVENYQQIRAEIVSQLEELRDNPIRDENPLIYHLDVAAMYPNIILTNRLQPSSVVNDEDCAACDFNRPGKTCLREMEWVWRGENYSATRAEYAALKAQLEVENFPPATPGGAPRLWTDLSWEEKGKLTKERLKKYCQKVYKRVLDKPKSEKRMAGVCQRENSFYVDTVRAFRDRRYEYKGLTKAWKGKMDQARSTGNPIKIAEASDMCVLYDSLQLAHKCILNSFYGYVMRKGARWYSMEMAGVVTHTGANIIKRANELIGQVGRPLELDTDGIWCCLPGSFPEEFKFKSSKTGKTFKMSYPCAMLNVMLAENNTNNQYATLKDPEKRVYETSSEMSIEFEVDGPYQAMILPASKEEGKLIKKRYAVFNFDGSLAELKGFELKRRGELKLIKVFQGELFDQFLKGSTLTECYDAVGAVANRWLDMLDTRGRDLTDEELLEHISEACVMSKSLEEYDGRKSCATTCALRLGQFLGDDRIRDKGLVCNYVIARSPSNSPTSERAIPVAIFSTEPAVARTFLRRWCGGDIGRDDPTRVPDVRNIVDWEYYKERLGSAIQKIITIPAAMQRVANPVPRVKHPDWLHRKVAEKEDTHKQTKLDSLFAKQAEKNKDKKMAHEDDIMDLEDIGLPGGGGGRRNNKSPLNGAHVGIATSVDITPGTTCSNTNINNGDGDIKKVEVPDRGETYTGWLSAKKQLWKKSRAERKRKKEDNSGGGGGGDVGALARRSRLGNTAGADVTDMFRAQAESVSSAHWQIVSIMPMHQQPGVYKAWTVINGRMHVIPLRIPRTIYIDTVYEPGTPDFLEAAGHLLQGATLVRRTLPGGAEPGFTFQLTMDEEQYREQFSNLSSKVNGPGMRAVYEDQLPPDWSAALSLGCVATLVPAAKGRPLGSGFDVSELQAKSVLEGGYFFEHGSLRHMVLHMSEDMGRGRGLLALHLPIDGSLYVWVMNPARRNKVMQQEELSMTGMQRIWEEIKAGMHHHFDNNNDEEENENGMHQDDDNEGAQWKQLVMPTMHITHVKDASPAFKAVDQMLARIKDRALGPTVLLLDAPDSRRLYHSLPALDDLTCVEMKPSDASISKYPTLGWQVPAGRGAIQRLFNAPDWLFGRLQAAQYAHLPLSAFGGDWVVDASDALFARQLKSAGHLLWTQDAGQPDLGSRPINRADELTLGEGQRALELSFPGVYRCVNVEVRISHLAVCAVLEAATLGELEGATLMDDQQGCGPAFRVLRTLAQSWMEDATRRSNIAADTLLRNMYRWVCSPASRLYNPAIQRAVQGLMRKLLLQLVAELNRLGARVVHVDTCSLVIATNKRNVAAAVGYTDYVLETLGKRELFQHLDLTPIKFWHTLLFIDRYNYLGVEASLPVAVTQTLTSGQHGALQKAEGSALLEQYQHSLEPGPAERERPILDCVFTMKDHLPKALQDTFMANVTEFIWLPWKEGTCRSESIAGATQGGSPAARDAAEAEKAQLDWLKAAVPNHFTEKLLRQVRWILLKVGAHDGNPDHEFPKLPGSHLTEAELGTPALAYVKNICHVFSLDSTVTGEVMVLRRQLLKMVHAKEFSTESEWKEPCLSLVLPDVICSACQDCKDLDLCRDPHLQQGDWRCGGCGTERDVGEIEASLVGQLARVVESYQLQDLKCMKCGTVATEHLQRHCDMCGGHLKGVMDKDKTMATFSVYKNIAQYHEMSVLEELAKWQLEEDGDGDGEGEDGR